MKQTPDTREGCTEPMSTDELVRIYEALSAEGQKALRVVADAVKGWDAADKSPRPARLPITWT